jgi:hypothetical protein
MAFSKKTAADSASNVSKLGPAIEQMDAEFQAFCQVSQPIPDIDLPDEIIEGLEACAKLIGFTYDVNEVSTFYMAVREGSKQLYGPALKAYGEGLAIIWGGNVIPVDGEESTSSAKFMKAVGEKAVRLMLDPKGYSLPLSVSLDPLHGKKDAYETLKSEFETFLTLDEFTPYLNRGESALMWSEVPDGGIVRTYSIIKAMDPENPEVVKSYRGLSLYEGKPCWVFMPGEMEDWEGVTIDEENPLVFTKNGSGVADGGGKVYEIKMGGVFTKIAFLNAETTYTVTGFSVKEKGPYGPEYVLDVVIPSDQKIRITKDKQTLEIAVTRGQIIKVNGNKAIEGALKGKPLTSITEEKPATLTVNSVFKNNTGKDASDITFVLDEYKSNARLQRLAARQAALKTA